MIAFAPVLELFELLVGARQEVGGYRGDPSSRSLPSIAWTNGQSTVDGDATTRGQPSIAEMQEE